MDPLTLLTLATTAYGGYQGYRQAKDAGASGIGRLLGTATGAYGGYQLGKTGGQFFGVPGTVPTVPGFSKPGTTYNTQSIPPSVMKTMTVPSTPQTSPEPRGIIDILTKNKKTGETDPMKIAGLIAAGTYFGGAFDQGPVDMYQPTYNLAYADFAKQRPGYTYIDPITGEEKEYAKVYIPEADPANKGDFRSGPYAIEKTRLRTGGLAEIKKFNEGGINYLPSKTTHDENDANNYVRASGYVEDGAGVGDKDEDTMLAQLADGEFVTRADGVLGAGIIAGANPNSMKDMREKGAQYFYEQQKRYKRVFDLLKDRNDSQAKIN
jgi:hypothetical protein